MSVGGSKGKQSSKVTIPDFLRPFVQQATGTAGNTLQRLEGRIGARATDDALTAGFTPVQELAQRLGVNRAIGEGGYFSTARDTLRDAAQGLSLDEILDPYALSVLRSSGGSHLPADAMNTLSNGLNFSASGMDAIRALARRSAVPGAATDALTDIAQNGGNIRGMRDLANLAGTSGLSDVGMDALRATAQGDFLFGGDAFDKAVEAAVRAAQPAILSRFGAAGRGTGGLAETAIGQAGIDAFAQQFGQERQNQLSAANALNSARLSDRGQSADIFSILGNLDLAGQASRASAANALGGLGLADSRLRGDLAGQLGDLSLAQNAQRLGAAGELTSLANINRDRDLSAAQTLGDYGIAERVNQLAAANQLPGISQADINLLASIGQRQQDLQQRRIDDPLDRELQLLMAALGIAPTEAFLGQKGKGSTFGFEGDL